MNFKKGEIYYIESDNRIGCEQYGTRPALIVGNDIGNKFSPVLEIVYFTSKHKKRMPTHVFIRGHGTALCEQIFTVDKSRIISKKGECSDSDMQRINHALLVSLGIGGTHGKAKKVQ